MLRTAVIGFVVLIAQGAVAGITSARYADPTTRYDHGILGDAIEYGALDLTLKTGRMRRLVLPENRVFEDIAPRLVDLDGDGALEVIVVETHLKRGARLAIYNEKGLVSATPFIGHTHRWLAPVGAADLDGDGFTEIAYIDRPHLAKLLKVWRFRDGRLEPVAQLEGLTNHQIGQDHITGGIRECSDVPEIITLDGDWTRIMATRLQGGRLKSRVIGAFASPGAVAKALRCQN